MRLVGWPLSKKNQAETKRILKARQKQAERIRQDYYISMAVDLLQNPIASMIIGVSAVNLLSKVRDDQGNPRLFSEGVRVGLQAAALGYPLFAGQQRTSTEKFAAYAALMASVGIGNIAAGDGPGFIEGVFMPEGSEARKIIDIQRAMNTPVSS